MSELKPCPFCGGDARTVRVGSWWCVACRTPFCCDVGKCDTEAEAIAAWNTRAERTCKQEEQGWGTEGDHARVWLTCGHDCMVPTVQDLPNYCPNCGAKVVDE
jgi:hypothetical protein